MQKQDLKIVYIPISDLKPADYNPRRWDESAIKQLTESIRRYGVVDPIICNSAENRKNIVIGGHFRLQVAKQLGYTELPVVYLNIPDVEKEKELNLRLNKNVGEFDLDLLAQMSEEFLTDVGFGSEELDEIFSIEDKPEVFDLEKELKKLDINSIEIQKGDMFDLNGSKLMCGDSTVEAEVLKLMENQKMDMCFTDPPYILDYLYGKKKKESTEGFGYKRDRRYLETDELPPDFTEKWMGNVHKVSKENFSIIVYENWKNIRTIWNEMEKYWKVRNMIVWHLPNRVQGFAAKYKFFNKHDIAIVGTSDTPIINTDPEEELFQNDYETALFAVSGKPHWENYSKGNKYCPTDFVEHIASDEKNSGQGVIFGTKPVEILIPYVKVLTKRDDLIFEPFGGSGSTLIAATKMKRKCYIMEKSPTYATVIIKRWENLTGLKARKL
jgi:DNA modification methylase